MVYRVEIRRIINSAGLKVVRTGVAAIQTTLLDELYGDLTADLRKAVHLFMGSGVSEVGEVKGDRAVERLLAVRGESIDPAMCGPDTVRGRFGFKKPELVGQASYFRNAIHCPRTNAEAERNLQLFAKLLEHSR